MNNNIVNLFYNAVKTNADRIAIIDKTASITYSHLQGNIEKTVTYLKLKGIEKADKVLVFVPMSIRLYEVLLALFHIGAIPVFLDEWSSIKRINDACKVAECKAIVCNWKVRLLSYFSKGLRSIPIYINSGQTTSTTETIEVTSVSEESTALITFSTGSTGIPKAALRTHGQLTAQFEALKEYLIPDIEKPDMTSLPIVLLINLGLGKTTVIPDTNLRKLEKMNTSKIFKQLIKYNVKSISASPYFIQKLADYKYENPNTNITIERLISGGAPVYPTLAKYIINVFPNTEMKIVYGSTEAEPISSISAFDLINQSSEKSDDGLAVGKPHKNSIIKIIKIIDNSIQLKDENELNSITLPNNEIGEIIVSGNHVQKHYLNNAKAETENKIYFEKSFWHRTGDSGFIDDDGKLFLTGRCRDLIIQNGTYLSPFLYEEKLQKIPNVVMGTIVKIDNILYAIVELKNVKLKIETEIEILTQIDFVSKVFTLAKMPRDPRHHSKIDYLRLRKIVKQ